MLSKTCEYAIRAMIFIAQKSKNEEKIGIKAIAKGINSPEHFLAKILQELSRKKLLQSTKGPNGGFYLDGDHLKYSLADIVKAIDGDKLFTGCGLGLENCSEKKPCPLHDEFKTIREKIKLTLQTAKVGEFREKLDLGLHFLKR
jgi:Rrf2 family protein